MATLQPRRCSRRAWKNWTLGGLRLVLRSPLFFCAWVALCLLRGWITVRIVGGGGFVATAATLAILALPETGIAWVGCRSLSMRMVPGRKAGSGWVVQALHGLLATGIFWRMAFIIGCLSLGEAVGVKYGVQGWGSRFALGAAPAIIVLCWFFWTLRVNIAEWMGVGEAEAGKLSRKGVTLNFSCFAMQALMAGGMLVFLCLLPVRDSLGWQAVSAGASVFCAMFLIAWNTCAMHDIFDTGEKIVEKQHSMAMAGRLASGQPIIQATSP